MKGMMLKIQIKGDRPMAKNKILHLFQWRILDIINNLKDIKANGWTSILITPVQPSKEEDNNNWCMRYQIKSLSIGNRYGTKENLIELCTKAHELGINIYVDIIITHFGNNGGGDQLFIPHRDIDKALVDNQYFWREKKQIDYNSRYSITHHCNGLAAIRIENYDYQKLVMNFINELIDCGIDGIRIDSAKMIALPEENFNENKNEFFKNLLENIKPPIYIFGEVIFEKKELIDKYQKYIDILTEFNKNSYSLNKNKTILFIESHDTFLDKLIGYSSSWDKEIIINQYRFLAKDFEKVLFFARPFDDSWKSKVIKTINLNNI